MFRKFLFLVPFLFAAPMVGAATMTLSFTDTTGWKTTELGQDLTLQKFNSNLGTLTKVELIYDGGITTSFSVHNKNPDNSYNFSVKATSDFSLGSTDADVNGLINSLAPSTLVSATGNLGPNGSTNLGPFTDTDSANATFTSGTDLSKFQTPGGSSLVFQVATLSGLTVLGGGGNIDAAQETEGIGTVTINYTYEAAAVPEPTSVIMLGLAGSLLGGTSLYRKRRA